MTNKTTKHVLSFLDFVSGCNTLLFNYKNHHLKLSCIKTSCSDKRILTTATSPKFI